MTAPVGDALSHGNLQAAPESRKPAGRRFFESDSAFPNHDDEFLAGTALRLRENPFHPDLHGGHERNQPRRRSSFDHYLDTTFGIER